MSTTSKPLIKYGWLRALLFLIPWVLFSYLFEYAYALVLKYFYNNAPNQLGENTQTIIKFLFAAVGSTLTVWLWRKFIDRRDFRSLGFEWKGFENDAWIGFFLGPFLLGIGSIALVLMTYLQFEDISADPEQLMIGLILMILVSYSEELIVRGYLLNNLLQSCNKWVALAISSGFFALMHLANPGFTIVSFANILLAGLLLGANYIYTKNLWFGMLLHFSWNFFQGPVYGFEVSGLKFSGIFHQSISGPLVWTGGEFGFEGSLLCALLMLIAFLASVTFFKKKYQV